MPPKRPPFRQLKFPLFPIIVLSIAFVLLILSISPYYQRREPILPPILTEPIIQVKYTCPDSAWVDCMPGPDKPYRSQCQPEFLNWAKDNCPGFEGAAL